MIMRHAKSDWSTGAEKDFDRPLNNKGKKDASLMGKELIKKQLIPDLIVSSPAERARQTTLLLSNAAGYQGTIEWINDFYPGDFDKILNYLYTVPQYVNRLLMIGHNPVIEQFASILCHFSENDISMPTSCIVNVSVDISDWAQLSKHCNKIDDIFTPKSVLL